MSGFAWWDRWYDEQMTSGDPPADLWHEATVRLFEPWLLPEPSPMPKFVLFPRLARIIGR